MLKESIIPWGGQAVESVHYSTGRSGCRNSPLFHGEVRLLNALLPVLVLCVIFQHVQHLIVVLLRSRFCTCTGTTHCSHSLSTGTWPSDKNHLMLFTLCPQAHGPLTKSPRLLKTTCFSPFACLLFFSVPWVLCRHACRITCVCVCVCVCAVSYTHLTLPTRSTV